MVSVKIKLYNEYIKKLMKTSHYGLLKMSWTPGKTRTLV